MAAGFAPLYLPLVVFSVFCCHGDQIEWLTNQMPSFAHFLTGHIKHHEVGIFLSARGKSNLQDNGERVPN